MKSSYEKIFTARGHSPRDSQKPPKTQFFPENILSGIIFTLITEVTSLKKNFEDHIQKCTPSTDQTDQNYPITPSTENQTPNIQKEFSQKIPKRNIFCSQDLEDKWKDKSPRTSVNQNLNSLGNQDSRLPADWEQDFVIKNKFVEATLDCTKKSPSQDPKLLAEKNWVSFQKKYNNNCLEKSQGHQKKAPDTTRLTREYSKYLGAGNGKSSEPEFYKKDPSNKKVLQKAIYNTHISREDEGCADSGLVDEKGSEIFHNHKAASFTKSTKRAGLGVKNFLGSSVEKNYCESSSSNEKYSRYGESSQHAQQLSNPLSSIKQLNTSPRPNTKNKSLISDKKISLELQKLAAKNQSLTTDESAFGDFALTPQESNVNLNLNLPASQHSPRGHNPKADQKRKLNLKYEKILASHHSPSISPTPATYEHFNHGKQPSRPPKNIYDNCSLVNKLGQDRLDQNSTINSLDDPTSYEKNSVKVNLGKCYFENNNFS